MHVVHATAVFLNGCRLRVGRGTGNFVPRRSTTMTTADRILRRPTFLSPSGAVYNSWLRASPGSPLKVLSQEHHQRFRANSVPCELLARRIESLSDYMEVFSSVLNSTDSYWFRGHADNSWRLAPSALRYKQKSHRDTALALVSEFKRIAEMRLSRPPSDNEELKWVQIARHYGLPTRLLDWTENALVALYFSCQDANSDGIVFVLNPVDLNQAGSKLPRILNPHQDADLIAKYLVLDGGRNRRGLHTVAINPVWNSERILLQRGAFTLHGTRDFSLSQETAPSLVGLPILRDVKDSLLFELQRVGVDEMTIFPELDHACNLLLTRSGL